MMAERCTVGGNGELNLYGDEMNETQIKMFVRDGNIPTPNRTSSPLDPIIASSLREDPKQRPKFSKLHDDIVRLREEFEDMDSKRSSSRLSVDSTSSIISTSSTTRSRRTGYSVERRHNDRFSTERRRKNRFSAERREGQFSNMLRRDSHRPKSMPLHVSRNFTINTPMASPPPPPPPMRPRQLSIVR